MNKKLKKIARVFGVAIASLITLYVLLCSWVNWSGARAWEDAKARLAEENVELDFRKLLPEIPPESENFARIPLLASLTDFTQERPTNLEGMFDESGDIEYSNPELRDRFLEIKLTGSDINFKSYFPVWEIAAGAKLKDAPDISVLLKKFEAEIAEVDAAAGLPHSQIIVDVGETFSEHVSTVLPFFQEYRDFQKIQTLRACRAIENSNREEAIAALKVSLQLGRASFSHPTLIGFLVGQAHFSEAYSIIWQGMKVKLWTEADLAYIQKELASVDLLDDLEHSLTFEMLTFQIGASDFVKSISLGDSRHLVKMMGTMKVGDFSSSAGLLAFILPSGVWDHNKAFGVNMMLDHSILPVRNRTLPEPDGLENDLKNRNAYDFLAELTLPAYSSLVRRGFYAAVAGDLVETACAIERYQLGNGGYPDSLDELVPEYLAKVPVDLMANGQPLKYEKLSDSARYKIYSIGENGVDDGGKVALKKGKTPRQDREQGDWVWSYVLDAIEKK